MRTLSRWVAPVCLVLWGVGSLTGCAVADTFAYRSVTYNQQAEETKNKNLLLNVVRAAYRRPLQFTDLTTITGQASGSVSAALSVPFAAIPDTATRIFTLGPSATVSGGPNFTVAVLNTKEFYQGILTPIQPQTVAFYLHEGFPKAVLLSLLISRIEYGTAQARERVYNDVGTPDTYERCRSLLQALINIGLDAEQVSDSTVIGPPLSADDLRDVKAIENLRTQDIRIVRYGRPEKDDDLAKLLPEQRELATRYGYYYQLETRRSSYRFCFDPQQFKNDRVEKELAGFAQLAALLLSRADSIQCHASEAARRAPEADRTGRDEPRVGSKNIEGQQVVARGLTPGGDFVLSTRSVEGIIYYLGEIVRRELELDSIETDPRPAFIPTVQTGRGYTWRSKLFVVSRSAPAGQSVSVGYEGVAYHVLMDPRGDDRSGQVMELVTQLLSQNNSAKDLPAPSVIPVISR